MPRIKKPAKPVGKRELARQAEEEARQAVFHEASLKRKPKRKYDRKEHVEGEEPKAPQVQTRWVKDEWGRQGEVFFDGFHYWLIRLVPHPGDPSIKDAVSVALTPEAWEKRKTREVSNNDESSGRSVERGRTGDSVGNHKRTTRKSGKRQKSTSGKTRTRKSVPNRKRSKVAKGHREIGKDVRATKELKKNKVATKTRKKTQIKVKKTKKTRVKKSTK